jgi:hypothetical protein
MAAKNETMLFMTSVMERLVGAHEDRNRRHLTLSQKDAAAMLSAVPPVATNGVVLSGAKLMAWIKEIDTYLKPRYWGPRNTPSTPSRSCLLTHPHFWRRTGKSPSRMHG